MSSCSASATCLAISIRSSELIWGVVAEVFETPWDFLMDAANHRRDFYDMDEGLRRWFWAMPWGERYIWGVTAGILRALHDRLVASGAEVLA